eukprot:5886783-Pyramimonas_sp.AAC.1
MSLLRPGSIFGAEETHRSEAEIKDMLFHVRHPIQAFFLFPPSAHPAAGVIAPLSDFSKTRAAPTGGPRQKRLS